MLSVILIKIDNFVSKSTSLEMRNELEFKCKMSLL